LAGSRSSLLYRNAYSDAPIETAITVGGILEFLGDMITNGLGYQNPVNIMRRHCGSQNLFMIMEVLRGVVESSHEAMGLGSQKWK
jgi:hypothetical protein